MTATPERADYLHFEPGDVDLQLHAWFTNQPIGYFMFWGDGTSSELNPDNARGSHLYEHPGGYFVRAKTLGGRWLGYARVAVRPTWTPPVTVGPYPANPELYAVTFGEIDDTGIVPRIRVNWRDGKPEQIQEAWGVPGASLLRYYPSGKHIVSVYELTANTQRHYRDIVVDHSYDPDFTLAVDGRQVTLTVTKAPAGKALLATWGDATTVPEPVSGLTATHTYQPGQDNYIVQLGYADASDSRAKLLTIPEKETR